MGSKLQTVVGVAFWFELGQQMLGAILTFFSNNVDKRKAIKSTRIRGHSSSNLDDPFTITEDRYARHLCV